MGDSFTVIQVTNAVAPDKLGGLERFVRELSRTMARRGHRVSIIAKSVAPTHPTTETEPDGIRIHRYRAPSKRNPLFVPLYPFRVGAQVRRHLRAEILAARRRGDKVVVHAHHPVPALVPLLLRIPYLYTFHAPVHREMLPERQGTYRLPGAVAGIAVRALRFVEGLVLRRALLVVTLSEYIAGEALLLGVRPDRLRRIPGGLDTTRFTPRPEPATPKQGSPVLFSARRLVPRTGVEQLVGAMPILLRTLPHAHLWVAGAGPRRDAVAALVDDLGLGSSVTLLGHISDDELLDWYRSADIAITPTQELEGFGLSTAEALSCGTPALVTPVGANPELVRGLGPGLITPDSTSEGIAAGVVRLWNAPADLVRIRSEARASVHPGMSWDLVAEAYEHLYEAAVSVG